MYLWICRGSMGELALSMRLLWIVRYSRMGTRLSHPCNLCLGLISLRKYKRISDFGTSSSRVLLWVRIRHRIGRDCEDFAQMLVQIEMIENWSLDNQAFSGSKATRFLGKGRWTEHFRESSWRVKEEGLSKKHSGSKSSSLLLRLTTKTKAHPESLTEQKDSLLVTHQELWFLRKLWNERGKGQDLDHTRLKANEMEKAYLCRSRSENSVFWAKQNWKALMNLIATLIWRSIVSERTSYVIGQLVMHSVIRIATEKSKSRRIRTSEITTQTSLSSEHKWSSNLSRSQ